MFSPEDIELELSKQAEVETPEPKLLFIQPDLLTHPTLPEPLHGTNPRSIMGSKAWDIARREVYAANNYHCWACGKYAPYNIEKKKFESTENCLHAHEAYIFDYKNCSVKLNKIVAVCPTCHNAIHIQRSQAMYDKGIFDEEDMWIIINNKEKVLKLDTSCWQKWRLIHKGKEYYSQFKDKKDWEEHYDR